MLELHVEHPAPADGTAARSARFDGRGGTLGRSAECDLVLADEDKRVSRVAAEIRFDEGVYRLVRRTSSHAVTVNGAQADGGSGLALGDGDRIAIAHYRLRAELRAELRADLLTESRAESRADPDPPPRVHRSWSAAPASAPGAGAEIEPARAAHETAPPSLDEIAEQALRAHRADFEPPPKTRPTQLLEHLNQEALQALREALARPQEASAAQLLAAFLDGAGLDAWPDHGRRERTEATLDRAAMRRIGELLRAFVESTRELLAERATERQRFGAPATTLAGGAANPLKLAESTEAALAQLLALRPRRGQMSGATAVRDAGHDLLAHQRASRAGLGALLRELTDRIDPQDIEARLSSHGLIDRLLQSQRKARLWELFVERAGELEREAVQAAEGAYGAAFERAYRAHLEGRDPGAPT